MFKSYYPFTKPTGYKVNYKITNVEARSRDQDKDTEYLLALIITFKKEKYKTFDLKLLTLYTLEKIRFFFSNPSAALD